MTKKTQLEIDFEPGLLEQFPEFLDVVRASVYGCGKQHQLIAGALDMSPSLLSRKLAKNPNDDTKFPVDLLPDLCAATGDHRPIYWLIERFMENTEQKRERAIAQLPELVDRLMAVCKAAGVEPPKVG